MTGENVVTEATAPQSTAPAAILGSGDFVAVAIRTMHPEYETWSVPVTAVFRRSPQGWQTVGLERQIEPKDPGGR